MEAIAQVAIEQSTQLILVGRNVPSRVKELRASFAWLLHVGPLINHELRVAFTEDKLYGYLVWYERVAHKFGGGGERFFFDGVPANVLLVGIQSSICLPDEVLHRMSSANAALDRGVTMGKLDALDPRSEQAMQLSIAHSAPDLPPTLPMQVRIFVSRARAVNNGMRKVHATRPFRQCENSLCCRLFCGPDVQSRSDETRHRAHTVPYLAALGLESHEAALQSRFCCEACAKEWLAQAIAATPDADTWLSPCMEVKCHKGRGRCAAELRAALKRNTSFKKHIAARRILIFPALGCTVTRRITQKFVDALNADTGALFLGTLLLESSLFTRASLPGVNASWRTTTTACDLVRSISRLRGHGDKIIETAGPGTPVLRRVRARALRLNCVF